MTKKDYERAALIAQNVGGGLPYRYTVVQAFILLFQTDNPRFDMTRFRAACVPGANVRARPRKVA